MMRHLSLHPLLKKSTEIIEQRKGDLKKSPIPFDKKLQRCIFAILQKNQFLQHRNKHEKF